MTKIRTAAVIGSGVMGSGIAAHLANVGIPVLLLDMVPTQLQPQEEAAGLTLDHPKVRNRFALNAMDKLKKTNPAPLYSEAFFAILIMIRRGNISKEKPFAPALEN